MNPSFSLVDTHAHLDSGQFDADRETVIQRALDQGIGHMVTVGCDLESSRASVAIAASHPTIYAAVGIHPHDAPQATDEGIAELRRLRGAGAGASADHTAPRSPSLSAADQGQRSCSRVANGASAGDRE